MRDWIGNSFNGLIAGAIASAGLTLIDILNQHLQLVPGIGPTAVLAKLLPTTLSTFFGIFHYLIGMGWGLLYGLTKKWLPKSVALAGCIYGTVIWFILMSTLMPYVGAGFFCSETGHIPLIYALVCDLIFGIVTAFSFHLVSLSYDLTK
jgi:hypothetical protein